MQERSNNGINLRLAFVGGSIDSAVGRTHVIASQMDRRFSLVSGCFSKNEKINAASAEEYGLSRERVYPSLESLLKNESGRIDAIAILTPQDQHFAQIMRCLREGMPVICEKSLVSSVDEASKVSEALSDSGLFLKVTYNYTGYPMVRELKEMICRGDLGTI